MTAVRANESSLVNFARILNLGCIFRLLPYEWNENDGRLEVATNWNLWVFNLQKNFTIVYTFFLWIRLVQFYLGGEFSLLTSLWALGWTNCSAGYLTLALYTEEAMYFANRLLDRGNLVPQSIGKNKATTQIESQARRIRGHFMGINLFLTYANPVLHLYLLYANPCCPGFLSSMFFKCESSSSNNVKFSEYFIFILFEFYNLFKWQYVASFSLCCIFLAMNYVGEEMQKLGASLPTMTNENAGQSSSFYRSLKKGELLINLMNIFYWHYMSVFPLACIAMVSLLLYGIIRYWGLGPQAIIMFPICAVRCGFEALSPLSAAGNMSQDSSDVLDKWRENNKKRKGLARVMQRSCRMLEAKCGSMFSFGKIILLRVVDICVNQTVNLLCSF